MEYWKEIFNFEGLYEASNFGNIRSVDRITVTKAGWTRPIKGVVMKPFIARDGKKFVDLCKNNIYTRFPVHHLILNTFKGNKPEEMDGCHNDGNGHNNHIDNLRWDTHRNNMLDKIKHGTLLKGSAVTNSKLNETQVKAIRELCSNGIVDRVISEKFNVSRELIGRIKRNQIWKHI